MNVVLSITCVIVSSVWTMIEGKSYLFFEFLSHSLSHLSKFKSLQNNTHTHIHEWLLIVWTMLRTQCKFCTDIVINITNSLANLNWNKRHSQKHLIFAILQCDMKNIVPCFWPHFDSKYLKIFSCVFESWYWAACLCWVICSKIFSFLS